MYDELREYLELWGFDGNGLSIAIMDISLEEFDVSGFLFRQWRNLADYAEDEDWRWFDRTAEGIFDATQDSTQRDWLTAIVSISNEVR